MHEPAGADVPRDVVAGVGPRVEQLVNIGVERVVRAGREALVVTVAGEVDLHTVGRFRAALSDGLDQITDDDTGTVLVIDLVGVSFLGSPGLAALVEVTRGARRRREPLRLVIDHTRPVIRPIEMTGLDDVLALYNTLDQALHHPGPRY